MSAVRVRIAPSPSGFLHIGTAKIALMNWLYARQQGGTFILRLEDTDAERTDEAFVQAMCDGFKWLGIDWDEGPPFGDEPERGEFGPYRQSQRGDLYRAAARRLIDSAKAYRCFCTKEDRERDAQARANDKERPGYSGRCRNIDPEESEARSGETHVVRFKVPEGTTTVRDLVQGDVQSDNAEFDDFVILKPNGDPIFHLAVVVDDGEMQISHVIRGDDHLTNAFKHVMLFEALGYDLPKFAHLPMVLDERGKKYSKREHGANVLDWRDDGYLPATMLNYVALLGWNPGDDRELFTQEQLIEAFSIERLGKSPAKFDLKKLQWLNGQHIRSMTAEDLLAKVLPILEEAGFDTASKPREWLARMVHICQEKIGTLNGIVQFTDFFFVKPAAYEPKGVKKHWRKEGAVEGLEAIGKVFDECDPWTHEALHTAFETLAEQSGVGLGQLVHPARLALTGKSVGPGLFELAELLGRETCRDRIAKAIEYVATLV
ncbi:MAG: glutamate--tRNA ligase [Candidatus Hydrogenedentes bacterium]|nr:glutamate--tRNA ligase [Candidatus Hydrogenedentota bacterium]